MARLQDFQQVTPSSSDNLLVVQATGQGLVPYGSKLDSENPTGTGSLSLGRKSGTTTGDTSVAMGYNCTASGRRSVAIGDTTTASGDYSFAINSDSIASGTRSFAQGQGTTASGFAAVSEGQSTTASGSYSYAQGYQTISNHKSQHVYGEYNVADTSPQASDTKGTYIEIVGNGTGNNARSNARTLDWSGNETIAGDLIFNGNVSLTSSLLSVKETTVNVAFDSSGEGTLFSSIKHVLLCADNTSDSKYVGYVTYLAGTTVKIKSFNRAALGFESNARSETRSVKVYYLE